MKKGNDVLEYTIFIRCFVYLFYLLILRKQKIGRWECIILTTVNTKTQKG